MQYTPHYNLNLPEGTDIVNPLIQDNPNYSAIDTALYDNKLRVIGTATHTKTGTNHSIVLVDSDIPVFRFVATGDYATGDTFSVDGVTVTPRVADGSSVPTGAFKINSTVEAVLDGSILNLINVDGAKIASDVSYNNTSSGMTATNVQDAIDELQAENLKTKLDNYVDISGATSSNPYTIPADGYIYLYCVSTNPASLTISSISSRYIEISASATSPSASVFVKKGMQVYVASGQTPNIARYFKLTA